MFIINHKLVYVFRKRRTAYKCLDIQDIKLTILIFADILYICGCGSSLLFGRSSILFGVLMLHRLSGCCLSACKRTAQGDQHLHEGFCDEEQVQGNEAIRTHLTSAYYYILQSDKLILFSSLRELCIFLHYTRLGIRPTPRSGVHTPPILGIYPLNWGSPSLKLGVDTPNFRGPFLKNVEIHEYMLQGVPKKILQRFFDNNS